jgi:YD repeat-containing protein
MITAGPHFANELGQQASRRGQQPVANSVPNTWQARDSFDPERLLRKFEDGGDFYWDDLGQLVRRTAAIDRDTITANCARGFRFLVDLTEEERAFDADENVPRLLRVLDDVESRLPVHQPDLKLPIVQGERMQQRVSDALIQNLG